MSPILPVARRSRDDDDDDTVVPRHRAIEPSARREATQLQRETPPFRRGISMCIEGQLHLAATKHFVDGVSRIFSLPPYVRSASSMCGE